MMASTGRFLISFAVFCLLAGVALPSSGVAQDGVAPPSGATGTAAGPRITLRLREVTLREAAAAVTRASQTAIDPGPALAAPGAAPGSRGPATSVRASFDWDNASLDQVLRELCARFHCWCTGLSDGYALYPLGPVRKSPHVFAGDGVRVTLGGVARSERRRRDLPRQPVGRGGAPRAQGESQAELHLGFLVDLEEAHAEWDVRLEKVRARDDLGNELAERFPWGVLGKTFPSQRVGFNQLPLARLEARRLTWVEGDVVLSPRAIGTRLELPYPPPGETRQRPLGRDGALTVSESRPAAPTPAGVHGAEHPDLPAGLLSHPAFEPEQGPSLLMRVHRPADPDNPDAAESFPVPRAVGRSGRSYPGRSGPGGARTQDGWTLYYTSVSFPGAEEPLEKLVWEFPRASTGGRRIHFRLTDVPLPAPEALPVQQESQPAPPDVPASLPPTPPVPFRREGGAVLQGEVRLHGSPAPAGRLRLGLSAREGAEWAPARWCEIPVDGAGKARLEGVAPGRYRVVRQYLVGSQIPAGSGWDPAAAPAGRWLRSEVEVEVPAAGVVSLAALELTAAPPAIPPAPARVAPRVAAAPPATGGSRAVMMRGEPMSITQSHGRATYWEGFWAMRFHERGNVSLSTRIVLPAAPAAPPAGIPFLRRVSALDDQGTVLTAENQPAYFSGGTEARGTVHRAIRLSAVHPRARELRWVEGELFSYRRRRTVRIETPFPAPGRSLLVREGPNLLVTVANDAPPPSQPAGPAELPDLIPSPEGRATVPQIRFRLCYRDLVVEVKPEGHQALAPVAFAKSGAAYRPRGGGGLSTEVEDWVLHALRASYPDVQEPLEKLVWELEVWEAPEPLGFFRMRNVPLATPRPQPALAGGPPGGGTIAVRLLWKSRSQFPERVFFGLSRREQNAWGPVRWTGVPVDERGQARLTGIRPGRYRITLRAAPRPITTRPVEVTVTPGRPVQLPPLRIAEQRGPE